MYAFIAKKFSPTKFLNANGNTFPLPFSAVNPVSVIFQRNTEKGDRMKLNCIHANILLYKLFHSGIPVS